MKIKIIAIAAVIAISCDSLEPARSPDGTTVPPDITENNPEILGLNSVKSFYSFEDTYNALREEIEANESIDIVAEVDHTENASSVNLTLEPTKIIFFGNANLGTPLMQQNQLAGLDLPQKILVYRSTDDDVFLAYSNTQYLQNRYGLDPDTALPIIEAALTNLSTNAGDGENKMAASDDVTLLEGIVTKPSNQNFGDTYRTLRNAIQNNENLSIFAEINHRGNAVDQGLELEPTRLIIFGNANLGSPLIQNARTTALDLPQKILVWRDAENTVYVSYNDPAFLKKRHGIEDNDEILETIATALDNLSNVAIGN